ncbi:MAG: LysM peptidoglycan-binding domain-containing protein [Caldilineaceae bacterium]
MPTPLTYVIKAGDLPATIAQQFGITIDALLAANSLSRQDVTRLRIGQVLIIPSGGSTASGAAPAANSGVTSGAYRLDAPALRSPESGTPMSCSARDSLVWNAAPFMAPADQFVLHLGFVSNVTQNGEQTVTWILELIREQSRTSWDLDSDYCSLAPQQFGRQWRWYVQVIDENGNPVSPPSDIWAFSWN